MRKKTIAVILIIAVLVGVLALAISEYMGKKEKRPRRIARPHVKKVYNAFAGFSGQAPTKTHTFKIDRGPWRLHWELDGVPKSASLSFTVFSKNPAIPPILQENGLRWQDSGTLTIRKAGVFYILVSSFDADWRLSVEKAE